MCSVKKNLYNSLQLQENVLKVAEVTKLNELNKTIGAD